MYKEHFRHSLMEPILMLHLMLGHAVVQHSLPISGMMREGHFYPDINPYPFMNAILESYFETRSSALENIQDTNYPQPCYESLNGWGVPRIYWNSFCREVFNAIAQSLLYVLPDFRQDSSTLLQYGITDTDDLILTISYYD